MMDLRVSVHLKMTCTLVCQKILLNSSVRPGTYGTEMKILLLSFNPVSGFYSIRWWFPFLIFDNPILVTVFE